MKAQYTLEIWNCWSLQIFKWFISTNNERSVSNKWLPLRFNESKNTPSWHEMSLRDLNQISIERDTPKTSRNISKVWRAVCFKIFFREFEGTTTMFQFRDTESHYFREIEMCHFREIKICQFREIEICHFRETEMCHFWEIETSHFRDIKILQFSGDWIVSSLEIEICYFRDITILYFSGDWNLSFWEIKLAIFERLKCSFFGGLNMTISGNWNVTFSGNEKIELSSFWKTEFFIFFGRNYAQKKNWKSKPTKSESKHTWATTSVDRICHEIQPAS